jgi:exopolysaccharide production protein ExoQ
MRPRPGFSNAAARAREVSAPGRDAQPVTARKNNNRMAWLLSLMGWVVVASNCVPWNAFDADRIELQQAGESYGTNVPARVIKVALLVLSAVIIIRNMAAMKALLKEMNRFFVGFLLAVPLSVAWSISPGDTIARYVTIMSIFLVWCAICVSGWEPQRFQKVMRPILTLLILGSMVQAWVSPDLAIESGEGTLKDAWRGLLVQKNAFGQLSSFTYILWLHALLTKQTGMLKALVFGACGAACMFLSRSSTSLLASVFVTGFVLLLLRTPTGFRRLLPYIVTAFAGIVMSYAMAILNLVPGLGILLLPIMALTGKDMTFSNRSAIWDVIKEHIQFSPYIGTGYGAYWVGPTPASPSYEMVQRLYFYPNESHNGYLDMVNDLGFVGLILLLGYLFWYIRQSLRLWRYDRNQAALYLAFFFLQAVINLSESTWLVVNAGISFSVMTFATVALARSCAEMTANVGLKPAANPRPRARAAARARR